MVTVVPFERAQLEQLASLVNAHISSIVPGWALPAEYLASRLERDPGEYVIGPWVAERVTLVALERDRVVAAAQLHRYADEERVGPAYRGVAEIVWLFAWPDAWNASSALVQTALAQLDAWSPTRRYAGCDLMPSFAGVADCWPHVAMLLRSGGFEPSPDRTETLWAGRLDTIVPREPPFVGLELRRGVANLSTRFEAVLDGVGVGIFDVASDLTEGGALPALAGWADVWSLHVAEGLRSRGIGTWLVSQAAPWLRLGGCDRIILTVAEEDGRAGLFYARFGWSPLARLERGWSS